MRLPALIDVILVAEGFLTVAGFFVELVDGFTLVFAYSQSEDDPRDKNAIKIYEDITNYLKNQPLKYFESLNYPSGDLVSLLYNIYDEVYNSNR